MIFSKVKIGITAFSMASVLMAAGITLASPFAQTASASPAICKYADTPYAYKGTGNLYFAPGQWCIGYNSNIYSIFQTDGNLVTYVNGRATWSSHTAGLGASSFVLQTDGNVVIYKGSTPLWNTHTNGKVGYMGNYIEQESNGDLDVSMTTTHGTIIIW